MAKALGRTQKNGDSIANSKGSEQSTQQYQDTADYKESGRRNKKLKASSSTVREETNAALLTDITAFMIPGNSDRRQDGSSKIRKQTKNMNSSSKKAKLDIQKSRANVIKP